ncbi:hypothetical protein BDU57DRAFT_544985 [Ampelomyces quisqualis]|uniref:Microbial-type PARG catalytic domain-containing protein n=1 Tax=Ampelomyces quisqualis TaxID=50730 RepID=A0A6A5R2Y8_AMPQU|nr:hypothetical protein BDU57DRAFT_544985 [Ampelomyces quisqualis]
MGRTEKSQGLAPPAVRKDIRAKQAKHVINKTIPALLASNARANRGVESSELIVDPAPLSRDAPSKAEAESPEDAAYIKRKGQGRRKVKNDRNFEAEPGNKKSQKRQKPTDPSIANLSLQPAPPPPTRNIRILRTDALTAAHILTHPSKYTPASPPPPKKSPNVCILNMASPLRPGGGVLSGATSPEEFLCSRTTLLPSLREPYYRLPERGGIWSPDVLVFHDARAPGDAAGHLGLAERYWVDVISAGMLRFPELEGEEAKRWSRKDGEVVEGKMRAVLRIAERKGVRRIVLGAWGCGAYGNPVGDVAGAWRRVLDGAVGKGRREQESWPGIEEVVFAIGQRGMAAEFAKAFGGVDVEAGPGDGNEEEEEEEDKVAEELRNKIGEMEGQLSKVVNPDLKARMGTILQGLRAQLREREGVDDESEKLDSDEVSSVGVASLTPEQSAEEEEEEDFDAYNESGQDSDAEEELAVHAN